MKPEECPELDECHRVKMILDKDMLDFQYAQCIHDVCSDCSRQRSNHREVKMTMSDVVDCYLREALMVGLVEMGKNDELTRCLNAELKLRLISMPPEELWELAMVTCPPTKTIEQVHEGFINRVEDLKSSAQEWLKDLENCNSESLEA